jgi:hypothetical protein
MENMSTPFHGTAYRYLTPKDGEKIIGVCQVMGGLWQVCWVGEDSRRHPIKSRGLPVMSKPETLQGYLETWASLHKLEEVVHAGQ